MTADPDDRVNADCENVQVSALGNRCSASTSVRMAKSGAIPVRVFCAVTARAPCGSNRWRGCAAARRKVVKLGSKSFSLKAGQRKTITVKVSKCARRFVQRKKRLSVRARISAKDGQEVRPRAATSSR